MNTLRRFRNLAVATTLLAAAVACKNETDTRTQADRAADEVNEQIGDVREQTKDLSETAREQGAELRGELADRDLGREDRREQGADVADEVADEMKGVGQNAREEVDYIPAGSLGGQNFGWRVFEGTACHNPSTGCSLAGHVPPILEYAHDSAGGFSITGGHWPITPCQ